MWLAVIFQQFLLFLGCVAALAPLTVYGTDMNTIKKRARTFFSFVGFFLSQFSPTRVRIMASTNNAAALLTKPVLNSDFAMSLRQKMSMRIQEQIMLSGKAQNPDILAQQSIAYATLSLIIMTPIVVLLVLAVGPYALLAILLPGVWFAYPKMSLFLAVSERKTAMEDEMVFFILYASVMQSIGQSIYQSFVDLLTKNVFPAMENEAKMLSRNVVYFGFDPLSALNEHAMTHPNQSFRNLLLGYVSISKSGGDLGMYLEAKSSEFFHKAEFRHTNYRSQAHLIGESMLILLTILPTTLIASSFLLAEESVITIMMLSFILIPMITVSILAIITLSQPKVRNSVSLDVRLILASILFSVMLYVLGQPLWLTIGVGVLTGALLIYGCCFRQFREISRSESCLPDFFRDITEYRKIGISIQNAIMRVSENRHYDRHFDSLLDMISIRLRHGQELSAIVDSIDSRSWTVHTLMFVLGNIANSGGGTAQMLEHVTSFVHKVNQTKKDTQSSISVISYFALLGPLLMSYTSSEMIKILQKLNSHAGYNTQNIFSTQQLLLTPELAEITYLLVVISGIGLGLVMSKLTYFTLRHTLILGVSATISVLSILITPLLPSLIAT